MSNEIVWKEVFPAVVNDISELEVVVPYAILLAAFAVAIGYVIFGKLSDAVLLLISVSYLYLLIYRCFLNRRPSENVAISLLEAFFHFNSLAIKPHLLISVFRFSYI